MTRSLGQLIFSEYQYFDWILNNIEGKTIHYNVFIFQKFALLKMTNNSIQMVMANCYHYV